LAFIASPKTFQPARAFGQASYPMVWNLDSIGLTNILRFI